MKVFNIYSKDDDDLCWSIIVHPQTFQSKSCIISDGVEILFSITVSVASLPSLVEVGVVVFVGLFLVF